MFEFGVWLFYVHFLSSFAILHDYMNIAERCWLLNVGLNLNNHKLFDPVSLSVASFFSLATF